MKSLEIVVGHSGYVKVIKQVEDEEELAKE